MRVRSRCARLHARPEGGHGEPPVKRPVIVLLCARFGLSPPLVVGDVSLPTGGGPTGSASPASVWLTGADPSSATRPRSRDRRTGPFLRLAWRDRRAAPGDPRYSHPALGRFPCVSERASSEVPRVRSRLVPFRCGSVPALARPLANGRGHVASHRARLRCLGPNTGWRPACRPLSTARSRRVTFHPYKGIKCARTVASGRREKLGSLG